MKKFKKLVAMMLAVVMTLALATTVMANNGNGNGNNGNGNGNNGNGPNHSSGGLGVQRIDNVEIRGNGNSARIWINDQNTGVRPANNTTTAINFGDYVFEVFVRGNAILDVNVIRPVVDAPYVPTVVDSYSYYRFVRKVRVASRDEGTEEVAGSRELVGLNVSSTFVEVNFSHIPDSTATGSGVLAGFTASGTLNYDYVRNYVERFERVYVPVAVTVWSNGDRDDVVGSEFVSATVDGDAYYTEHEGSRAIDVVSGNTVRLVRGHGQGYLRSYETAGGFTVGLYLANQSPRVDVVSIVYDINAL